MTFSFIFKTLLSAGAIGAGATILTNWVTNQTTRKQQFLTTITQNRQEWREQVRKEATEFCYIAYKLSDNATHNLSCNADELLKDRLRLRELETLLCLRMNSPNIACSNEIVENTKKVVELVTNNSDEELLPTLDKLKHCFRNYLESSWKIAKEEAETGSLTSTSEKCSCKEVAGK